MSGAVVARGRVAQVNVRMDREVKAAGDAALAAAHVSPSQFVRSIWMTIGRPGGLQRVLAATAPDAPAEPATAVALGADECPVVSAVRAAATPASSAGTCARERTPEEQAEIDRRLAVLDRMFHRFEDFGERYGLSLDDLPHLSDEELKEGAYEDREAEWRTRGII